MLSQNFKQGKVIKVLAVDDEVHIVNFISDTLGSQGYEVDSFVDSESAFKCLLHNVYDLALIDINMPVVDGGQLAREFLKQNNDAEVVVITGAPDEENIDPCLKLGLTHFLFKPFNKSQLIYTVYAALHFQRLRRSYIADLQSSKESKFIGISEFTRLLRQDILTTAQIDLPVLIVGESGTGKEIVAHEVHQYSDRREKFFLPINCALLGSLAESELFGHVKGSFTGANGSTDGHVGIADGGMIFFDEVGELSIDIQAKLLRFLDSGEYMRVGESKVRKANIRVVTATNRDLEAMCRKGEFREDLFYRLSGSIIRTAPLKERREDIMPLIWHFLFQFGVSRNTTYEISADACARIVDSDWPGNVRQLKQSLFKISQLSMNGKINLQDVERVIGEGEFSEIKSFKEAKKQVVDDFERRYLLRTLQISQGNLKKALVLSGMHKKNFYQKINSLGLLLKDFHPQKK